MSKRIRQQAVMDIVTRQRVPSQSALVEKLRQMNFDVTQATLSRDIAELNLVKSKEGYLRPEDASASGWSKVPDPLGALRRLVIKIDEVGNFLVIKTPRSSAQQIGLVFDDSPYFNEVVGTIAGDDTVLVITKTPKDASAVKKMVYQLIK